MTLTPRFVVLNKFSVPIRLRQFGTGFARASRGICFSHSSPEVLLPSAGSSAATVELKPGEMRPYYWPSIDGEPALSFRLMTKVMVSWHDSNLTEICAQSDGSSAADDASASDWAWSGYFRIGDVREDALLVRHAKRARSEIARVQVQLLAPEGESHARLPSAALLVVIRPEDSLPPLVIENRFVPQIRLPS